jgi:DNA-binding beta-propeller fold protein YncE
VTVSRALAAFCGVFIAGSTMLTACASTELHVTGTPIPSLSGKAASFDDVEIDQAAHRLYVADRTNSGVDVFDISTPAATFVKTIHLSAAPSGLAVAPDLGQLFAGLASGSVAVVDTQTDVVVAEIKTGAKSVDLLDYSPAAQLILAGSPADQVVTAISTATGKVLSTAKIGKAVEQPRYDAATKTAYVSVPDLDALVKFDPMTGAINGQVKLGGCLPRGLAIDAAAGTAMVACSRSAMSVDLASGQTQVFNRATDGDVVSYDAAIDRFLIATPQIVFMFGGSPIGTISSAVVPAGKAAVYDETNDLVYIADPRSGTAGLAAFKMEGTRQTAPLVGFVTSVWPIAAFVVVLCAFMLVFARQADPIRRRQPAAAGEPVPVSRASRP